MYSSFIARPDTGAAAVVGTDWVTATDHGLINTWAKMYDPSQSDLGYGNLQCLSLTCGKIGTILMQLNTQTTRMIESRCSRNSRLG